MIAGAGPRPAGGTRSRGETARLSAARLAAVQALYQAELTKTALEPVILQFLAHRSDGVLDEDEEPVKPDAALFTEVARGTGARSAEIADALRSALPPNWPLERVELLLRCVLRAGVYELMARPAVPARVVVAEYVDLADAFFEAAERGMANAVLDRLARTLRREEFATEGGRGDDEVEEPR